MESSAGGMLITDDPSGSLVAYALIVPTNTPQLIWNWTASTWEAMPDSNVPDPKYLRKIDPGFAKGPLSIVKIDVVPQNVSPTINPQVAFMFHVDANMGILEYAGYANIRKNPPDSWTVTLSGKSGS